MMQKPITIEDHQASRMIADATAAARLLHRKRRRLRGDRDERRTRPPRRHPPAWIMGAAQGSGTRARRDRLPRRVSPSRSRSTRRGTSTARPASTHRTIDAVMIYDHFTPFVIFSLEAYGFCERGEGGPFVEGGRIDFDGELPVNTHGGNHSEAYIHGLPHVIEACASCAARRPRRSRAPRSSSRAARSRSCRPP